MSLETGAARVGSHGDFAPVTDLHDLADLLRSRGLDNAKGDIARQRGVRAPFGSGVGRQLGCFGRDVFLPNNVLEISPCSLEVPGSRVMCGRTRAGQWRRGQGQWRRGGLATEVVASESAGQEHEGRDPGWCSPSAPLRLADLRKASLLCPFSLEPLMGALVQLALE